MSVSVQSENGGSHSSLPFHSPFLLSRRKGFLQFAIDEEITKDATWAPCDTIRPSFDAGRVFFVDEDASALDQRAALTIVRPAWNVVKLSAQTGLEQN